MSRRVRRCLTRSGPVSVLLVLASLVPVVDAGEDQASGMELTASAARVTWRDAVVFAGAIDPNAVPPECLEGVEVVVERDAIDDGVFPIEVARARTDAEGRWSAAAVAKESSMYWATTVAGPESSCEPVVSNSVRVDVRLKVETSLSDSAVRRGESVRVTVRVRPRCPDQQHDGDVPKIPLYQLLEDRFVRIAGKSDVRDCTVTFRRPIRRQAVFMSRVAGIDSVGAFYLGGRSQQVAVGVRRS